MKNNKCPDSGYFAKLARQAGEITRQNFCLGMEREWKEDETPLTATDTAINDLVLNELGRDFPHVRVIGEEGSDNLTEAEYTVYCDPVDGTIPFCLGVPISSFCISVVRENTPLSAVIYDPFSERLWSADKGCGCHLEVGKGKIDEGAIGSALRPLWFPHLQCSVSKHSTIHKANICMVWWQGSPYNLHDVCPLIMSRGGKWMNPASIAYFGGLVASGQFEATIFPGTKAWETAAMQIIVEESGGKVTDIHGNPMRYAMNGEIKGHIISNGLIHDQLVELVEVVN